VATAGLLSGRTFTIVPKGLTIGRDPAGCEVVVADDEISRLHAWIGFNDEGEVVVRDRHSANGTYVNGVRIQEKVLRPTDEIAFGSGRRHLFRVERVPGGPSNPTAAVSAKANPGTSALSSPGELGTEEEKSAIGTVVLKLTGLMARPHLELIVDKYAVRTLDLPDTGLTVGRDSSRCQLLIEHPSVSGVHSEFRLKDGKALLADRSTNGTFVNGRRVTTVELHDGDYITFGRYAGKSLIFKTGLEPELKVEKVDLTKDRVTIGRDASNDVVIDHPVVSKRHAEIATQDGKTSIIDLGSTNGTFVNGIKVRRHQLQQLDRIVVGPSELRFSGASLSHVIDTQVVRLDVQGVNFQVVDRNTGKPKVLVDDISLVVKPRELIGLLGPSGAGKSTLMNALNGFVRPTGGQVLYNGVNLYDNLASLKSTIGYVPQEDIVHRQLSVRRCLYYAAKLRLPEDLSEPEVSRRVEEMLDTLKIDRDRWESPVATLSGGQRKRVSLGIELLSKPGVLFLDEPTAGLDPRTETLMMMLFRQLANQGSSIVITTHLLGSFGVLDKVVVLLQGRMVYYGPGTKFLEYFKAEVPPDVYDDLTDNNNAGYALELKRRFEASALYKDLIVEPLRTVILEKKAAPANGSTVTRASGFSLHQFKALARRNWELKFGDSAQTLLLFLQAPLVALLVGLMASQRNQVQTLFMAMFASLWFGCSNAVREIVDEQTIYRRERQTGLKIPSYIFSKLAVLSFVALAQCVCMVFILLVVNHALALGPQEIAGAIGIMFLVAVNGTLIGLAISGLVRTPEKALTLFPLVLIPELLLSGLFLPVNRISPIIDLSVEQLLEGKVFAQPETRRKLQRMVNPPAAERRASSSSASSSTELGVGHGAFAHQVVGAVAPSPEVEHALHKYTPQPVEGMPSFVRWLSVLAVSRWGLEALSDLCLHGAHSTQDYAYRIINTIFVSLHPDDQAKLEAGLEAPAEAFLAPRTFPLPSVFWRDKGPYLEILVGYAVLMTGLVLYLMKRRDV
jgi:ABC-type multidrug transport system ATPase subunit/pSer/pThr/pTyr-binding forkhead associated (FHA) protein